MVSVNCAAIPETLIESELFGREKGAYTGAYAKKAGSFEFANGSTLFLDEVGEMPLEAQSKLLRVLEEKKIQRLGSPRDVEVDVRIIAASNRDLEKEVLEGRFRSDLYYRLNVFWIMVPPLRERREDIPLLVEAFAREFGEAMGKSFQSVSKSDLVKLTHCPWPGNIRELRNVVERAAILSQGPTLRVEIPGYRHAASLPRLLTMDDAEREHMRSVLETTGWQVGGKGGAAEILGMRPSTLRSRMSKLGLHRSGGRKRYFALNTIFRVVGPAAPPADRSSTFCKLLFIGKLALCWRRFEASARFLLFFLPWVNFRLHPSSPRR